MSLDVSPVSLLRAAFPLHGPEEPALFKEGDAPTDDLVKELFYGRNWPEVEFPDENPFVVESFGLLSQKARLYFLPSYAVNAIDNPFHRHGFLLWVEDSARLFHDSALDSRLSTLQIRALLSAVDLIKDDQGETGACKIKAAQVSRQLRKFL